MSNYSDNLRIDTPENVPLDAEIAGFGSRCIAAFLDYLILLVAGLIVTYLFIHATAGARLDNTWIVALFVLLQFSVITFYHLFFEFLWNGQSPGKRLFGLRVIQANGMPLTTNGALIRNLVRVFDFFPACYGVGLIVLFATKHTQRFGDLAAGTIVIRERKAIKLDNLREDYQVNYERISRLSPIPPAVQQSIWVLDDRDRREIVNFLRRRQEMKNSAYVVTLLAKRIASRMGLNDASGNLEQPDLAEIFLEQVARAFEIEQRVAGA